MPVKNNASAGRGLRKGAHIGGARTLADVRGRCVINVITGCWNLRTGHGRPQRDGVTPRIWVHGIGNRSAAQAVWRIARNMAAVPHGMRCVRMCGTRDCANPAHIEAMPQSEAMSVLVGKGNSRSPGRRLQLAGLSLAARRLTPGQVAEIRHSNASARSLGAKFGCSPTTIANVRRGVTYRDVLPGASVFAVLGPAA